MEENKTNIEEMENQDIEEMDENLETASPSKLFTEDEVNKIVQKRLDRFKSKMRTDHDADLSDLLTREKELSERENTLNCKEYLIRSGYDLDFINIIETSDVEQFMKKADLLAKKIDSKPIRTAPPLRNPEGGTGELLTMKIVNTKHEPKKKCW